MFRLGENSQETSSNWFDRWSNNHNHNYTSYMLLHFKSCSGKGEKEQKEKRWSFKRLSEEDQASKTKTTEIFFV